MLVHAIPKKENSTVKRVPPPAPPCECCSEHVIADSPEATQVDVEAEKEINTFPTADSVCEENTVDLVEGTDSAQAEVATLESEGPCAEDSTPNEAPTPPPTPRSEEGSEIVDDNDTESEIDEEDTCGPSVRFQCDAHEPTDDSPEPVSFTADDFPALRVAKEPPHGVVTPTVTWAGKVTSAPQTTTPLLVHQGKRSTGEVVGRAVEDTFAAMRLGDGNPKSNGPGGEVVSSRILSVGSGGQSYASAAWIAKQALEDDGIGWVSPSNLSECRATGEGMLHAQARLSSNQGNGTSNSAPPPHPTTAAATGAEAPFQEARPKRRRRGKNPEVHEPVVRPHGIACITTDYAMQNVMLQMGLQLVSVEGRVIDQVKQWVIRCGACFQIHFDMDRLFCTRCGSDMMQRISASVDSRTGELRLHLKKNYVHHTRGKKYSLPAPGKQGRFNGELLLREDQLLTGIWRQKTVKVRKDVRSAFGEDITSDVGLHINKGSAIKVGLGKRNPNSQKGRERRGKKK